MNILSVFPLIISFADFYLGQEIANGDFVHYPNEKWFPIEDDALLPNGILDDYLLIILILMPSLRLNY